MEDDIENKHLPAKAKALAGVVVYIYFLAAIVVFAPYYNWRFAQEHSVIAWIFGGEIVSTAKAVVWPYFVWSDHESGIRSAQAKAYFKAIGRCGISHTSLENMLRDAVARADERSKILGPEAGRRLLRASFRDISKTVRSDIEEANHITPPEFLKDFHTQNSQDGVQISALLEQLLEAVASSDEERTTEIQKQMSEIGQRYALRLKTAANEFNTSAE